MSELDEMKVAVVDNSLDVRLRVRPMYYELGFSDRVEVYARAGVVRRLMLALKSLPKNIGIEVWDVYRPRQVQRKLFDWMQCEVERRYPDFTESEILNETRKFVSPPAKVGEDYCPPHLSGGAVDLTLFDRESGLILEMGTPFDDCSQRAHALYFEHQQILLEPDKAIRDSRALLRNAMLSVGFTLYEYEWWHFDYGNIFWSQSTNTAPLFGPLFGDNEWWGEGCA